MGSFTFGRFGLDHHHRQAVQEQHDIGDDVPVGAQDPHLELAHGKETVVRGALEIHESHRGAVLPRLTISVGMDSAQHQLEHLLVALEQIGAGESCRDLADGVFDLVVFQPRLDRLEPLAKHR
jgi:hypothetical protein